MSNFAASGETVGVAGGLKIFFRSLRPKQATRACVVIVPGFNSHGLYYTWVAEQLQAMGIAAYAVDLRGRGKSDGERFHVETFDDYVRDVEAVVSIAAAREPDAPIFLLGHSAGGVVTCLYALRHQAQLAGLVCESFAYALPAPGFALALFKGLSYLIPHARLLRLSNAQFSRNPAVVNTMNADPLIAREKQTALTVASLVRANERLKDAFPQIVLPLLILHGTQDAATRPTGSQYFHEMAGSDDISLKLYEGGFHDLLNDTDKDAVMGDILAWLDTRTPVPR